MPRLHLVRHGEAEAGFGSHLDPGLSATGQTQAASMASVLEAVGPLDIVTSPLQRTRETAGFLEKRWATAARVESRVAEIPSPSDDLDDRAVWLVSTMAKRWSELDTYLREWRASYLEALAELETDTVVVTHFIGINAAYGHATDDDRVVCFAPGNCSVTVIDSPEGRDEGWHIVEQGEIATSVVH